jgi:hypothetical protein
MEREAIGLLATLLVDAARRSSTVVSGKDSRTDCEASD